MGRPLRIDFEGAWHHVMHRGAGRRIVFRDDDERTIMLRLVGELHERFGLEVHAYVLMGNHFHLLIRSASGRLSEGMQWLLSNFTRWVNACRSADGAIFRGRYHAVPVETAEHRYLLVRYIAENPLDLREGADPTTYEWSSFAHVVAGNARVSTPWLFTDLVEELYGVRAVHLSDAIRRASGGETSLSPLGSSSPATSATEAFDRLCLAASAAAGLGGTVERRAVRVGAALVILDATGRWSRHELADAAGLTRSAVASAVHRTSSAAQRDVEVRRFLSRVAELAAADTIPLGV